MIKVLITGTNEVKELKMESHGINWVRDFIGNTGALEDGQFTWNGRHDYYEATQDTYDWWEKVIADHLAIDKRIDRLIEIHGKHAVIKATNLMAEFDLAEEVALTNKALDEAFGTEVQ